MFGRNQVSKPFRNPGTLLVNDLFDTIQGEGPDAGRPAIFLRLAKCNLRCYFCDTEFETGETLPLGKLLIRIWDLHSSARLLVITGGEPLLQNFLPVVEWANGNGIAVSVETAGSIYLPGLDRLFAADRSIGGNLIVCSPKTPQIDARLKPLIGALKYLVEVDGVDAQGLPCYSTQRSGVRQGIFRPANGEMSCPIYVQAIDTGDINHNRENQAFAAQLAMKHDYRLSVQLHKIVGLP